jgi:hypothetical protein
MWFFHAFKKINILFLSIDIIYRTFERTIRSTIKKQYYESSIHFNIEKKYEKLF